MFGYSFKDALLTAASSTASSLGISQSIAGHNSTDVTGRYARLKTVSDTLQVTKRLVVPQVDARFGD